VTSTIFLIRHAAHTDLGIRLTGRRDGVQLSEAGRDQAKALGERMKRERLVSVYSSPRERAAATAAEIAASARLPVTPEPALDEIDFGDWTGSSFDELGGAPLWDAWNSARGSARPPGGEAMTEAVERAKAGLTSIASAHAGQAVALVSHADIIRGLAADLLGLPLDNLLRFDVDPASITTLLVGDWGGRVISLNERISA
jgi:broad specificity phosphatase PhoE